MSSIMENVVKECAEEASIPDSVANTASPVGAISYVNIEKTNYGAERVMRDTLFRYLAVVTIEIY